MRLKFLRLALISVLATGLTGCHGSEPSESQMRSAVNDFLNHSSGATVNDPIEISAFTKQACDKPNEQGYHCTFTMTVTSANELAQMFNNLTSGEFYMDKDSGKWAMRPPF